MRVFNEEIILEMSKLIDDLADESLCGDFGEFIYFSPSPDSHGPRVKFYGGTKETSTTRNAPSLAFTNNGDTEVIVSSWMNRKNCPNAFDKSYVLKVHNFIQRTLPILLLVWYFKLDEAYALKYFEGSMDFDKMLNKVKDIDEKYIEQLKNIKTINELHNFCLSNNIYKF